MPKIDDVTGLIRAIGERDYNRAKQHCMVMIGNERGSGRERAAIQLERSLHTWGADNSKLVELPPNIKSMLYSPDNLKDLSEIWLNSDVQNAVNGLLAEREKADILKDAGLPLRNRILLAGPPGNGKTTLAGAISKKLNLPFYVFNLPNIVNSHLGETSKSINMIMEYAFLNRCIIFLDELDAIGRVRGGKNDSADREYSLIVNTLLTSLDRLPDNAIVIGATNMPELLDPALMRRFNLKLWMDSPTPEAIEEYIAMYMDSHAICFRVETEGLRGQPWSKVEEYCIEEHRGLVLGKSGVSGTAWIGSVGHGNVS